jgi:hypothetical protein
MTTFGDQVFQYGGSPVASLGPSPRKDGQAWFVDGDHGLDGNSGRSPNNPFKTIGHAIEDNPDLKVGDVVYVFPRTIPSTDSDPVSYDETIVIDTAGVSLIGLGNGRVQGGLPQMKIGAGSTVMIDIKASGVLIQGIGINGYGSTGGGIMITDDGTDQVIGTTIIGCHLKNCARHATNGGLGGAINWSAEGGGWQVLIKDNTFYKNLADIALLGTNQTVPQDVVIQDNVFSGPAANVDVNIITGGSGINGLTIDNNVFPCFPAIGSGSNAVLVVLTGSVGIISSNVFACTGKTMGAAGDGAKVPTTMLMVDNYQEDGATQWART